MSVIIDDVRYYSASEVMRELGITRQTLWRWRQEGKVPSGHRYRNRQVLFSADDLEIVRKHANRIEPIALANSNHLELFGRG